MEGMKLSWLACLCASHNPPHSLDRRAKPSKFIGGRTWRAGGVWDGVGEHLLGHIRRSQWRGTV